MLNLRDAQQRGDDGESLIEPADRPIKRRLRLCEGAGIRAAALEAYAHPRQRRAQIVSDVVADAGNLVNEGFDLVQHAVDHAGELVEWIADSAGRQPLP